MRIVFPTKENMSYISHMASLDEADYLTVVGVHGQNITDIETVKTSEKNRSELLEDFRKNHYSVLITNESDELSILQLKKQGVSVYEDRVDNHLVLEAFSSFVQDKLIRL